MPPRSDAIRNRLALVVVVTIVNAMAGCSDLYLDRRETVALAADDPFFANGGFGLIDSWRAAKKPAEFHLYEQGGHGFGMYPKETTSTGWFNAFVSWLTMHGMAKPQA